jgi:hypothetical protein
MDGRAWMKKQMAHAYEADANILHFWFPDGIELTTEERIDAFSDYGVSCALACTRKPYLLVDYSRIFLEPMLAQHYSRSILKMKGIVVDAFRYGMGRADPNRVHISVSVRSATAKGFGHSNFFPNQESARAAIRELQKRTGGEG